MFQKMADTPRMYEICSAGPVVIYYIPLDKKPFRLENTSFAFQIQHGWQPLLLSTAHCFARIICQSEVPVYIPNSVDVVVKGTNVKIFAPRECFVRQDNGGTLREEEFIEECELPQYNVVTIYCASLRRFGDRIEALITDGMKVYCEGAQKVRCVEGSDAILVRHEMKKKSPTSP